MHPSEEIRRTRTEEKVEAIHEALAKLENRLGIALRASLPTNTVDEPTENELLRMLESIHYRTKDLLDRVVL